MARRLPRGRTMGYGCPPPLAGGGVASSNADTRVITALLTTATEGGEVKEGGEGEMGVLYTHTCTSLQHRPVMPPAKVMRVMLAVKDVMGHRWMDGQIQGWIDTAKRCMDLNIYWYFTFLRAQYKQGGRTVLVVENRLSSFL